MNDEEFYVMKKTFNDLAFTSYQFKKDYLINHKPIYSSNKKVKLILTELVDTEYPFNSEKYGFRGIMDVLFKGRLYLDATEDNYIELNIPFELKTGKRKDSKHFHI